MLKTYFDPADPNRAALVYRVKPDAASTWGAPTQFTFACHWARLVALSAADDPVVAAGLGD